MKFNANKFEILRYGKEQEIKSATIYKSYDDSKYDDSNIDDKEQVRDLGMMMSNTATFTLHIIIIIIIILESAVQGRGRVRTLSIQRPQPHTTNPWKEEKDKTVGDNKERADHANRKALTLLCQTQGH